MVCMIRTMFKGLYSCITQKNPVRQELSSNNVGDNTLNVFVKASPVDLEDILVSYRFYLISSLLVD